MYRIFVAVVKFEYNRVLLHNIAHKSAFFDEPIPSGGIKVKIVCKKRKFLILRLH